MGGRLVRALRAFRGQLADLLWFGVLFHATGAAGLAPVAAWSTERLVATSGGVAVSNGAIAAFLLSPTGLAAAALAASLLLALLYVQQCGILAIAVPHHAGLRTGPVAALARALGRLPALLRLGLLQLALAAACLAPWLLAAAGAAGLLLGDHDVNYYLSRRPPELFRAAALVVPLLGIAAALAIGLAVRWLYAPALVLFESAGARAALRESASRTRGERIPLLGTLALWAGVVAAAGSALGLVDAVVTPLLLGLAGTNMTANVAAVVLVLALEIAATQALAFTGFNVAQLVVSTGYDRSARARGIAPALPGASRSRTDPRSLRVGLALAGVLLLAAGASATGELLSRVQSPAPPAIVAHRGSSRVAPENTLAAVERAIADGAEFAEIDVQETADGVVVVLHDADLMRVAGDPRKIWELRHADLAGIDVGSWFAPKFSDQRVPTLAALIERVRGRIGLLIELKFNGHDVALAERTARVLRERRFVEESAAMSLDAAGLVTLRRELPELPVGLTIGAALGDVTKLPADFVAINARLANRDFVSRAHLSGREVWVWTVNEPQPMLRFLALGVDAIITDEPAALRELRDDYLELEPLERLLLTYRFTTRS